MTLPTISALLGHNIPGTTGRYLRHIDVVLKAAADRISAAVRWRLEGHKADVVSIAEIRPPV